MEEKRADQKRTGLLMRLVGGLGKTAGKGGLGLMGFFKKFIGGKLKLILMGIADTLALLIMVYSGNFEEPEFSSVSASTFGLITILILRLVFF